MTKKIEVKLEVQYVPMDKAQEIAWRAGLRLLLDLMKLGSKEQSVQKKPKEEG